MAGVLLIHDLDLTVILVSWNTKDLLAACLNRSMKKPGASASKSSVIDNQSGDGSPEMVESSFPEVMLIRNQDNRGFAAACNQGLRLGKGRFLLLLNSDTVVLDGALQKAVAYMDSH